MCQEFTKSPLLEYRRRKYFKFKFFPPKNIYFKTFDIHCDTWSLGLGSIKYILSFGFHEHFNYNLINVLKYHTIGHLPYHELNTVGTPISNLLISGLSHIRLIKVHSLLHARKFRFLDAFFESCLTCSRKIFKRVLCIFAALASMYSALTHYRLCYLTGALRAFKDSLLIFWLMWNLQVFFFRRSLSSIWCMHIFLLFFKTLKNWHWIFSKTFAGNKNYFIQMYKIVTSIC